MFRAAELSASVGYYGGITERLSRVRTMAGDGLETPQGEPSSILSKAFELLRAFNQTSRVMTLSELSRASGLPKSTVHRLIARLVDLGAVEQHRSGYVVSLDLMGLVANTPAVAMRDAALPYLAGLHRWSGLAVQLAVLRQFDVVYLEKIAAPTNPAPQAGLGSRLPANCTALGLALLSWENLDDLKDFLPRPMPRMTAYSMTDVDKLMAVLRRARAEGIARESEDAQLGLAGVAVPIVIHDFAVGAVGVSHLVDVPIGLKVEQALRDTAAQVARECKEALANGKKHWFPYGL